MGGRGIGSGHHYYSLPTTNWQAKKPTRRRRLGRRKLFTYFNQVDEPTATNPAAYPMYMIPIPSFSRSPPQSLPFSSPSTFAAIAVSGSSHFPPAVVSSRLPSSRPRIPRRKPLVRTCEDERKAPGTTPPRLAREIH